uniref:Nuclear speckle splicing regulatory protein 1 N-terminal domain-containing protein n=1 Tax=Opuntia streptacantha TaxID=393608 RepID=A0A7C9B3F5_OPUST
MQEKKYGLQLRVPKSQQKQQQVRPPIPKPAGFNDDDDDDVEQEISRQAAKNKSLKDVEEQHKKALEEDPSVFDYDGVYDDMKAKIVQPKAQDRQQRQSKYIQVLMEKAKQREREHEIVYERKLAKERSKDDHLYADKDKFVTSAYKRKLAEQAKWMEEQRLRELREERDDVTKKSDLTDFYFNLSKNVAFGASEKSEARKPEKPEKELAAASKEPKEPERPEKESVAAKQELKNPERHEKERGAAQGGTDNPSASSSRASSSRAEDRLPQPEPSVVSEMNPGPSLTPGPPPPTSAEENTPPGEQPPSDQPRPDHHKKSEDALAAAKERFLARKRAKVQ